MKKNYIQLNLAMVLSSILTSACVDKQTIANIPDAENVLITNDKRVIVTGGENIYEIIQNQDPKPLFTLPETLDNCSFTGIAEHDKWLFTSCVSTKFLIFQNKHLLAADLSADELKFEFLNLPQDQNDPYDRIGLPNGMTFAPDGSLLVADSNYFSNSGVARVELDFSGQMPEVKGLDKDFVSPRTHGVKNPNGLRVADNHLYLSDGNSVKRFTFDQQYDIPAKIWDHDGNEKPNGIVMWSKDLAFVDDIMPYCGGVALTSFISGRIHYVASYIDDLGEEHFPAIYSTVPLAYRGPSALAFGSVPNILDTDQLLVTEKGVLFELNSDFGNQLVISNLSEDLADPNTCNIIQDLAREMVEG